jgi:hypothetical protein
MAVRTCVWMDVLDEVVMVSLLTRRLSCAGDLAGGRGAGRQGAPGGYSTGPISAPASSA